MKLLVLEESKNKVAAVYSNRDDEVPLFDFLQHVPTDMDAHVHGLQDLFCRYAEHGRRGLTSQQFHEANKRNGIWSFRKGRLRVYCFLDGGNLIIATHGCIKTTQKADAKEVQRAIKVKERYFTDQQAGKLNWEHR